MEKELRMAKELSWKEEKQRDELAARKQRDEQNRDPEIEQCVIAYVNWVKDFGPRSFEAYRREWLQTRGKMKAEVVIVEEGVIE
jgi:uncharacterized protein affecting Mg2+/Co2+ transport